jgi:small neutral amino acid transporter SnatA (MarC family)
MKSSSYAGVSAIAAMLALVALSAGAVRARDLRSSAQTLGLVEQRNLTVFHGPVATPSVTAPQSVITAHPVTGHLAQPAQPCRYVVVILHNLRVCYAQ